MITNIFRNKICPMLSSKILLGAKLKVTKIQDLSLLIKLLALTFKYLHNNESSVIGFYIFSWKTFVGECWYLKVEW